MVVTVITFIGLIFSVLNFQHADRRPGRPIKSIDFAGANRCWLVERNGMARTTADGGKTWTPVLVGANVALQQLTFCGKTGWAIDNEANVWKTIDSTHWKTIANLRSDTGSGPFEQISFLDNQNGYVVDPFSIWWTHDGGTSWKRHVPTSEKHETRQLVHFYFALSIERGWLGAENGVYYTTTDSSLTWQSRRVFDQDTDLSDIRFLDSKVGWLSAWPRGGILATTDGGKSWVPQSTPVSTANINSICFINSSEGWAAGSSLMPNATEYTGLVLHSGDGGRTWQVHSMVNSEAFEKVFFADHKHGWLSTRSCVFHTTNGGVSWDLVVTLE